MNVALRRPMTVDEFLASEEGQALRYEFDGFRALAMTGGTIAHAAIQANLITALMTRLRGTPYRPYGSDLKFRMAGRVRYPDAVVVCSPLQPRATWVAEPVVVFEVLGGSTAPEDLFNKNAEYQAAESVRRYVILEQTHAAALVFSRRNGEWAAETVTGESAVLAMPEIGIEVPLAELYEGVAVSPDTDAAQDP